MSLKVLDYKKSNKKWTVLTKGQIGEFAAYEGPEEWTLAKVAAEGTKVSRARAEELFPDQVTPEAVYRR